MARARSKQAVSSTERDVLAPLAAEAIEFRDLIYKKQGGVAEIIINRPQVYNAYATGTLRELSRAVEDASFDDAVGVIVLTGAGSHAFCTGG